MTVRLIPLAGLLAFGVLAPAAVAAEPTVSAYGTGQVAVTPANPKSDPSIRAAIDKAQTAAIPAALADARATAQLLADGASLTLGAIISVSQQASVPGFVYFGGGVSGAVGLVSAPFNGSFCRNVSRPVFGRVDGKRKVVRRVRERRCFFPRTIATTVEVTFAALPKV